MASWLIRYESGANYNVTRILAEDKSFNQTAYEAYSPVYIPIASPFQGVS
jgi:hypothetical protein